MIQATARVLQNVVELSVGGEAWIGRPVGSGSGAISRRITALFSTVYETYRAAEPETVHSTVSYAAKKDEILIQIGEQKWRTRSSLFGPITFEFGGLAYEIHEKLTGRFGIFTNGRMVAAGELGFRSCVVRDAPPELEGFLANLALGLLIRTLVWEMFR
ncbi:MAG TPA: hypothetical protein VMH78_00855 [Thermoplasmata archaeon]|nr:hypothetical protein [Thermoplasmata archaeon]